MYGIFNYIWLIFMGNVSKYTIDGWSGIQIPIPTRLGISIDRPGQGGIYFRKVIPSQPFKQKPFSLR